MLNRENDFMARNLRRSESTFAPNRSTERSATWFRFASHRARSISEITHRFMRQAIKILRTEDSPSLMLITPRRHRKFQAERARTCDYTRKRSPPAKQWNEINERASAVNSGYNVGNDNAAAVAISRLRVITSRVSWSGFARESKKRKAPLDFPRFRRRSRAAEETESESLTSAVN